jgi:hypothetical protein
MKSRLPKEIFSSGCIFSASSPKLKTMPIWNTMDLYAKKHIPGAPTVRKIAPVIPSSYSRKMNQMGNTQDTGIILVQARGALRLVGSSFFSVFVCSVIGVVVCSYVLKCRRWDLNRGPLPLLI